MAPCSQRRNTNKGGFLGHLNDQAVKMRPKAGTANQTVDRVVKGNFCKTRKLLWAIDGVRNAVEGPRDEESIAAQCRNEGFTMLLLKFAEMGKS